MFCSPSIVPVKLGRIPDVFLLSRNAGRQKSRRTAWICNVCVVMEGQKVGGRYFVVRVGRVAIYLRWPRAFSRPIKKKMSPVGLVTAVSAEASRSFQGRIDGATCFLVTFVLWAVAWSRGCEEESEVGGHGCQSLESSSYLVW